MYLILILDPRRNCILFCKLEDRPNFAMLRPMVVDGTKCGLNTFDICVNGHCLVVPDYSPLLDLHRKMLEIRLGEV